MGVRTIREALALPEIKSERPEDLTAILTDKGITAVLIVSILSEDIILFTHGKDSYKVVTTDNGFAKVKVHFEGP